MAAIDILLSGGQPPILFCDGAAAAQIQGLALSGQGGPGAAVELLLAPGGTRRQRITLPGEAAQAARHAAHALLVTVAGDGQVERAAQLPLGSRPGRARPVSVAEIEQLTRAAARDPDAEILFLR